MREQVLDDVVARRFLLGQLPPDEEGRIQELAFEDPDTFTFLESVEDDLIDEFINGELSADEEQRFKRHFLSVPDRRNNLKISRVMRQHFDKASHGRSFPLWFKLAAALALVIFLGWICIRLWEARQSAPIQAGPDRPAPIPSPEFKVSPSLEPTRSPAHAENKPKSLTPEKKKGLATYALLLPSAASRSEGVQELPLAPDAPTMTIELPLITQRNFVTYEATLENEAGTVIQRWPNLKAENLTSGKALKIEVPVALLKPHDFYRIVVSGVSANGQTEVIARYPFEVKA